MSRIINHNLPHIGDLIFTHLDDQARLQCRRVSKYWKKLADKSLTICYRNLMTKVYFGDNMDLFNFLLERVDNFDWNATLKFGFTQTAFMQQCVSGNLEMVEWIIQNIGKY